MKNLKNNSVETADDEIDLKLLLAMLWAKKWLIFLTTSIGLFCGLGLIFTTPPTYQANALLQIEENSPSLAVPKGLTELMGGNATKSTAELQLLHARLTLGTVVAKMHLDWSAKPVAFPLIGYAVTGYKFPIPNWQLLNRYARPNDAISLSYLKVPPEWHSLPIWLTYKGNRVFNLILPDGSSLDGQINAPVANVDQTFAVTVQDIHGAPGRAFVLMQIDELSAIDLLERELTSSEQGKGTGVIRVTFNGHDPNLNSRILDSVLEAFYYQNLQRSSAEAEKSLEFVESQLPDAAVKQQLAENALNAYRSAQKSIDLTFETESLLTETKATEEKLRELAQRENEIKAKYSTDHPIYRQLIDTRMALQDRLDQLSKEIGNLPETQKAVLNLSRALATAQAENQALQERAQELKVLRASTIGTVRIVDPAATPLTPIAPRKAVTISLAALLGALVGLVIVALRENRRRGIEDTAELEALDLPVYASISLQASKANSKGKANQSDIVSYDLPGSIILEEFKSLRTSLHFGMLDARNQSLAFTSGAPGVGKSFVSANIAAVSAAAGLRVCLVDADLRRGRQRVRFGFKKSLPGLSEYLSEETSLDAILHTTNIDGLTLLATGAFPPNPSELLMRDRFKDLIAQLCRQFDQVIIDCPPILAVTDAAVIGRAAGATFIVARHQVTEIDEVSAAQAKLQASGVSVKGAILNAFDRRKLRTYDRKNASQSYSYAYQTIDEDRRSK